MDMLAYPATAIESAFEKPVIVTVSINSSVRLLVRAAATH